MTIPRSLGMTILSIGVALSGVSIAEAELLRGPYLQMGTPTSMVIRWRTDVEEDSRVRWGSAQGSLTETKDDATAVTDHEVTIDGLTPGTTYFYAVGSTTADLAGDDTDHFFTTGPEVGTRQPTRIWAIGDSGYPEPGTGFLPEWIKDGDAVRDAYISFNGGVASADVFLLLGDNAYDLATDEEYQTDLFEQYPGFLRTTPAWACIGNHEGFVADSLTETGPYYEVFTLPAGAEAGGVPSGTESYYSFDYANMHFVVLDSEDSIEDPVATAAMQDWLEADLAAADADWLIAFWHRPPYSRGFLHDSDVEQNEIDMRESMNPILEDYGVDIVLSGHSHHYERSFLIDGHYGFSDTFGPEHLVDGGTGNPTVDGAYEKAEQGLTPHSGAVYVVAGSASEVRNMLGDHPVMAVALESLGSFVLDVDGLTAKATFLNEAGAVLDTFQMTKAPTCPPTPMEGCTTAGKSKLIIKESTDNAKDSLKWIAKSMNVDPAELGDPSASDVIDLCLYDGNRKLIGGSLREGAPFWKKTGSGAKYKDKEATALGMTVAKAKANTSGKGQFLAKGKGSSVLPQRPFPLPIPAPVRMQAKNDGTGACWESVFSESDVTKNETGKFIAKN